MEDNYPKIAVAFVMSGLTMESQQVENLLGFPPSSLRTPDDWPEALKNQASNLPDELKPRFEWVLEMSSEHCWILMEQLEKLGERLYGKEEEILNLCENMRLTVNFLVSITTLNDEQPEIVISPKFMEFASKIKAEISFDIYSENDGLEEKSEPSEVHEKVLSPKKLKNSLYQVLEDYLNKKISFKDFDKQFTELFDSNKDNFSALEALEVLYMSEIRSVLSRKPSSENTAGNGVEDYSFTQDEVERYIRKNFRNLRDIEMNKNSFGF